MLRRRSEESGSAGGGTPDQSDADAPPPPATDELTGALQRSEWLEVARAMYRRSEHSNERFAVVFIRLEGIRDLNDLFGPEDADLAVQTAAHRLAAALGDQVPLGRWAGTELCLLWPSISTVEAVTRVSEELMRVLAEPAHLATSVQPLRCRIGAALFDPAYQSSRALVDDAHDALVEAAARTDKAPVARDESTRNRLTLRVDPTRLQEALTRNEFRIVWQPIVALADRSVVGVEALLRWEDSRAGTHLLPSAEFLPMLERTGMIVEVGEWVAHEACRQVKAWNDQRSGPPLFISVNLAGAQIEDATFAQRIVGALEDTGLPPELLNLDITESCLAAAGASTWDLLRPLKMLGVQLTLDGLGTGATAVAYLRELQLDMARINRVFIADLVTSPDDQTITSALIGLVHALGVRTLAQGIETEEQAAALLDMGCELAQGFLFGKPMLAEELGVPG